MDIAWLSTYLKKSFRKAFKTVRNQDVTYKEIVENEINSTPAKWVFIWN